MFDLTTIQLMNNHPVAFEQDPNYRTRDLIRPDSIRKSSMSLHVSGRFPKSTYVEFLERDTQFSPQSTIDANFKYS